MGVKRRIGGRAVRVRKDGTTILDDEKKNVARHPLQNPQQDQKENKNYTPISSEIIKKHGFASTSDLVDYVENQYWSKGVSETRKEKAFKLEDAPWGGKNTALLTQGNRTETASFVNYLKHNLNVYVESYGNGSWFVHMSKDADGVSKKKFPKRKR